MPYLRAIRASQSTPAMTSKPLRLVLRIIIGLLLLMAVLLVGPCGGSPRPAAGRRQLLRQNSLLQCVSRRPRSRRGAAHRRTSSRHRASAPHARLGRRATARGASRPARLHRRRPRRREAGRGLRRRSRRRPRLRHPHQPHSRSRSTHRRVRPGRSARIFRRPPTSGPTATPSPRPGTLDPVLADDTLAGPGVRAIVVVPARPHRRRALHRRLLPGHAASRLVHDQVRTRRPRRRAHQGRTAHSSTNPPDGPPATPASASGSPTSSPCPAA